MYLTNLKINLLLLLTALIWGVAFIFQKKGMEWVGPFTYTGVRFILGSLFLYIIILADIKIKFLDNLSSKMSNELTRKNFILAGIICGTLLYFGANFQQVGLKYTTAGNAAFITSLYVIFVSIFGLFLGYKLSGRIITGVGLAVLGFYFLSITDSFKISYGDTLEFICAVIWAFHVLTIAWVSKKVNAIKFASFQFFICGLLSLITAGFTEVITFENILNAWVAILYGGIISVGIAYTIQVIAQAKAHPAHASLIMSLENVFAVMAGIIFLNEIISNRGILGCILIIFATIISQLGLEVFNIKKILKLQ